MQKLGGEAGGREGPFILPARVCYERSSGNMATGETTFRDSGLQVYQERSGKFWPIERTSLEGNLKPNIWATADSTQNHAEPIHLISLESLEWRRRGFLGHQRKSQHQWPSHTDSLVRYTVHTAGNTLNIGSRNVTSLFSVFIFLTTLLPYHCYQEPQGLSNPRS